MPFVLKQVGPNAYFVVNENTGRRYSAEPLTKEVAEKQMKALYARVKN